MQQGGFCKIIPMYKFSHCLTKYYVEFCQRLHWVLVASERRQHIEYTGQGRIKSHTIIVQIWAWWSKEYWDTFRSLEVLFGRKLKYHVLSQERQNCLRKIGNTILVSEKLDQLEVFVGNAFIRTHSETGLSSVLRRLFCLLNISKFCLACCPDMQILRLPFRNE